MPAQVDQDPLDPFNIEIGQRQRERERYNDRVRNSRYATAAERNAIHIERLRSLSRRAAALPMLHPSSSNLAGTGSGLGGEVLEVIAKNCLDAARALETGVDSTGKPLSTLSADAQVGRGLLQMVIDMSDRVGLTATVLDANGVRLMWVTLDDINGVAGHLTGKTAS